MDESNTKTKLISTALIGLLILMAGLAAYFVVISEDESEGDENPARGFVGKTKTFGCGDTITESCIRNGKLTCPLNSTCQFGLIIGADDITINGANFTLTGPSAEIGGYEAIHVRGHKNITIKNLVIREFNFGVYLEDVENVRIENSDISYGAGSGIWLLNSSDSVVTHNTITTKNLGFEEQGQGILLSSSSNNNLLEYNEITTDRGGGIFFEGRSNENRLHHNFICGNSRGDIRIEVDCVDNSGDYNTFNTALNYEDTTNGNPSTFSCPSCYDETNGNHSTGKPDDGSGNGSIGFVSNTNSSKIFHCGENITENCTLNGNLICSSTHGLVIAAENITIDGNGYYIDGAEPGPCDDFSPRSGILNRGYDNVTIKNLEIKNFCNGIYFTYDDGKMVYDCLIDNCSIHDNGNDTSGTATMGIKWRGVFDSTISNCTIYNNRGSGTSCESGGNGIFIYGGDDNLIINNTIYDNTKAGIFSKMRPRNSTISDNLVKGNGQGGIVLRCKLCSGTSITHNTVTDNTGAGIYVGGPGNTVAYNTVTNNNAGSPYQDDVGDNPNGIRISRDADNTTLISNTVLGNDEADIYIKDELTGTQGFNNTYDTYKGPQDQRPVKGKKMRTAEQGAPKSGSTSVTMEEITAMMLILLVLVVAGYGYSRKNK